MNNPYMSATTREPATPLGWMDEAACAGRNTDLFFTDDRGSYTREAYELCGSCPVRAACLEQSLRNNEQYGLWAGLTLTQRREILKKRAAA